MCFFFFRKSVLCKSGNYSQLLQICHPADQWHFRISNQCDEHFCNHLLHNLLSFKMTKPKSVQRLYSDAIEWKIKTLSIADMNKQLLSEWVNLAKRILLNGDRRTIKKIWSVFAVIVHWNAKNEFVVRKKAGLQSKWQCIKEATNVFEAFYFSLLSIMSAKVLESQQILGAEFFFPDESSVDR